jgi:transcriptional regulator with XRE-family HTH domain
MTFITLERSEFYDVTKSTLGDRLTAAREARGLNQKDLARRLGTSPRAIQTWELDQKAPASNRLHMLAGILNVSIAWLLTGEGKGILDPLDPEIDATEMHKLMQQIEALKNDLAAASTQLANIGAQFRRLL